MSKPIFNNPWNIPDLLRNGWYFYQKTIESYQKDCRVIIGGHGEMLMFGGYSYLGLNGHPQINRAVHEAVEGYGTGAHGARLLAGTLDLHKKLEARIARFKQTEAASVYTSGYIANFSTIACLVGPSDTVICDKLNHASIIDGCRLSGANLKRFRHNDVKHLEKCLQGSRTEKGRKLVIVDAVFSMDGDIANLPEISRLCKKYGAWLMVDEAHSIGVIGETGRGIEEHFGLPSDSVDIKMGTLSKAIPSSGGYIAGSRELCEHLNHQARGFIYSGALAPTTAAAALAAFDVIEDEPKHVRNLQQNTKYFARLLRQAGFSYLASETAIFPIVCGENSIAWEMARLCQMRGIYVQAIPYPVVPQGMSRLRVAVMASHRKEDLEHCVSVLQDSARKVGGILENPNCDFRKSEAQKYPLKIAA